MKCEHGCDRAPLELPRSVTGKEVRVVVEPEDKSTPSSDDGVQEWRKDDERFLPVLGCPVCAFIRIHEPIPDD